MKHFVLISMILVGCGDDDQDSTTKTVAAVQESLKEQDASDCAAEGTFRTDATDKRDLREVCD